MDGKRWDVDTALIDSWIFTLSRRERARMVAVISMLADFGPGLGRPHVGKIVSSRHSQMKELRVSGDFGRELRELFCFAPDRRAVLLRGGDKSGQWSTWYRKEIPVADDYFDDYLGRLR